MSGTFDEYRKRPVMDHIARERTRQDVKWGEQDHSPVEWISVLVEEVGEAAEEANKAYFNMNPVSRRDHAQKLLNELIQVAAVAAAAIESLERNELRPVEPGRNHA